MAQQDLSAILKQTLLSNADFTEKINSLINTYSGEIVAETAVDVIIDLNKTAATETFFDNITDPKITFSAKERGYLYHEKGRFYYNDFDYETALTAYQRAIELRKKGLSETNILVGHSLYMASYCERKLGQLKEAVASLKAANRVYKFNKSAADVVDCQARLGDILGEQSDYAGAMIYYETAVTQYQQLFEKAPIELADVYWNMGEVSNKTKDYKNGEDYAMKAYQIYQNAGIPEAFRVLEIAAEALLGQRKYDAALQKYTEIEGNLLKNSKENAIDLIAVYQNISIVFKNQKKLKKAQDYIEKAAEIINKTVLSDARKSHVYHNFGATLLELTRPEEALPYFQESLILLLHHFKNNAPTSNPIWIEEPVLDNKTSILKTLDYKARAFRQLYRLTGNQNYLNPAYQTYQSYSELVSILRSDFYQKGSKLFWLKETYSVFARALNVTYALFEKTNNPVYAQAAFELMEKNKSVLLLEASQRSKVEVLAAIPDSLLQQKETWNQALADLIRERLDLGKVDKTDSRLVALTQKINAKAIQLQELEFSLRDAYPTYQKYLAQRLNLDLKGFAKYRLSESMAFIEFFVGEEEIYIIGLTQNNAIFHKVSKGNLQENITQFCAFLKTSDASVDEKRFAGMNQELSQQLLFPILNELPKNINELIIVPDGQLAYLPFDILLSEKVDRPANLPYLLKKYAVGYANSATLFQTQKTDTQKYNNNKLIGFAPTFKGNKILADLRSCTPDGLSPLAFNQIELEKITQHFSGEILAGDAASVDNFLANSHNCRILHLATHACVDDQNSAQSRIYFTDNYLYAHELYQQQISAEMVVLSACETGVGTYAKGEGMMSLARGFSYAGIPSVTTSLWSVNDETTAELMDYFYQHLAKGESKHIALQQAKLQYLASQDRMERLAPFYWAGFVHYGQTAPIVTTASWWKWEARIAALLVLILAFFWWRRG
ncbi:MAG: CHAT domain-containing protein [Paraglaciecola sp.]|jgi:CHAT domain-containing protein